MHFQELAHRIPSNYFALPTDKDKEKEKEKDKGADKGYDKGYNEKGYSDMDREMSQGREEVKEASGGQGLAAQGQGLGGGGGGGGGGTTAPLSLSSLVMMSSSSSSTGGGMTMMLGSSQQATTTTASSSSSSSSSASSATAAAAIILRPDNNNNNNNNNRSKVVEEVAESKTHAPLSPTPSQPHPPSLPLAPVPSLAPPHARRQELALALVSSPVSQQSHQYAVAQLAAKSLEDALEVGNVGNGISHHLTVVPQTHYQHHTVISTSSQ